ncbi:hypothetical protein ACFFTQ_37315 [Streptomyces roseofulvus]|uniref:hypothetical protein n=1 Tax=Streptomyces roseofulvus TaxID=33902 RepID=UPI0035E84DDD
MSFSFTNPQPDRGGRSFSFTDPQPEDDGRSFSFTGPDPADIDQQLQTITDMATEILRLVADVRRQINT